MGETSWTSPRSCEARRLETRAVSSPLSPGASRTAGVRTSSSASSARAVTSVCSRVEQLLWLQVRVGRARLADRDERGVLERLPERVGDPRGDEVPPVRGAWRHGHRHVPGGEPVRREVVGEHPASRRTAVAGGRRAGDRCRGPAGTASSTAPRRQAGRAPRSASTAPARPRSPRPAHSQRHRRPGRRRPRRASVTRVGEKCTATGMFPAGAGPLAVQPVPRVDRLGRLGRLRRVRVPPAPAVAPHSADRPSAAPAASPSRTAPPARARPRRPREHRSVVRRTAVAERQRVAVPLLEQVAEPGRLDSRRRAAAARSPAARRSPAAGRSPRAARAAGAPGSAAASGLPTGFSAESVTFGAPSTDSRPLRGAAGTAGLAGLPSRSREGRGCSPRRPR